MFVSAPTYITLGNMASFSGISIFEALLFNAVEKGLGRGKENVRGRLCQCSFNGGVLLRSLSGVHNFRGLPVEPRTKENFTIVDVEIVHKSVHRFFDLFSSISAYS
jgi:hypothetical protein